MKVTLSHEEVAKLIDQHLLNTFGLEVGAVEFKDDEVVAVIGTVKEQVVEVETVETVEPTKPTKPEKPKKEEKQEEPEVIEELVEALDDSDTDSFFT